MPSSYASSAAATSSDGITARASSPSPARRITAFAIDFVIIAGLTFVAIMVPPDPGAAAPSLTFYSFLPFVPAAYLLFRDCIAGRSLGKLAMGLVVWDERTGQPAGFLDSVIRNAPLAMLLIPVGGPLAQGILWPLYIIKLVAAMVCVVMLWQILRGRPRRVFEGPATTRVIDARKR